MHKLSKKLHPKEPDLRKVEKWLEDKLGKLDEELKSVILMAGNELLENAVKFHIEKGIPSHIDFHLTLSHKVEISVTNRFETIEDISRLLNHIDSINNGADPRIQYMYRLKEIMEKRVPGESGLGLLRIAGEGNFRIDYEVKGKKLTVLASKYVKKKREEVMKSLITDDFAINVKDGDPVEILWTGRSRDLNPSLVLDTYLEDLLDKLLDCEILIDFTAMDSLNSSTIPPILSFLKGLEQKRVRTEVKYDKEVYWQKASFKPLSVLTRDFQFVKISAV